jgi:hypothetical protein
MSNRTVDPGAVLQIADTELLCMVARGEVDLNAVARQELANRGLNRKGQWVGFPEAAALAKQLPVRTAKGVIYCTIPENEE